MNIRRTIGFVGAFLLTVGVFAPFLSVPGLENINYLSNRGIEAVIVLILAAASFILTLAKRYKWLWLTGSGALVTLVFSLIYFELRLQEVKVRVVSMLAGEPAAGAAAVATRSIEIKWGYILLILGAMLVMLTAAIKEKQKEKGLK
ncbi:MAG: hypothetical protein WCQ53_06400 [bacterium]